MLWTMMKDPVVWGSLLGIGIIVDDDVLHLFVYAQQCR